MYTIKARMLCFLAQKCPDKNWFSVSCLKWTLCATGFLTIYRRRVFQLCCGGVERNSGMQDRICQGRAARAWRCLPELPYVFLIRLICVPNKGLIERACTGGRKVKNAL